MCQQCQNQQDRDARFWKTIRRALLMVAKAIETRYVDRENQRAA